MDETGDLPRHRLRHNRSVRHMILPRTHFPRALALLFLIGGLLAPVTAPADPSPRPAPDAEQQNGRNGDKKPAIAELGVRMREELLQMTEFFDNTLPGTLKKYNLVLSFTPRLTDARSREFIRFPITLRYGLRNQWEVYGGLTPFIPNPVDDGKDHRWGLGEGRLGVRHDVGRLGRVYDQVTIGLETRTPLGEPPVQIIDHNVHIVPYISTARKVFNPHTTFYTNYAYDRTFDTPTRGPRPAEVVHNSVFAVTSGVLYKPGEYGASGEYSFRYFENDATGCHLGHEFKAGPIWDLPLWRTQSWGLPGKWQLEVAGRVTLEEGAKTTRGVSVRVRWRTSVREIFSKKSYERVPRP